MKTTVGNLLLIIFLLSNLSVQAKNKWPKDIPLKDGGKITIYQPQPESLDKNILRSRAALSVKKTPKSEPVFGVIWAEANLEIDRTSRMATMSNIKITDARFPDATRESQVDSLKAFLAKEIPKWNLEISIDELAATLEQNNRAADDKLNTAPPKVIYSDKPAILLLFDGQPIVRKDEKMNMERVSNAPMLIVKSPEDSKYYLYGQKTWYSSSSLLENWALAKKLPKSVSGLNEQVVKYEKEKNDTSKTPNPVPVIIVSTEPTELIQSNGEAKFAAVENTGLLYMSNSVNNVFMEVGGQEYYVLLSGRWYKSTVLKGPWTYIASDKLPADFTKIPEGSEKDGVLASVAGTDAARDAVMDAQIPQTAKLDRKTATIKNVTYDGEPKFENISGTKIDLAVNTSSTVMRSQGKYYCVENGAWFISSDPKGPWTASDHRPADVDSIPPSSPAYNTKYVYVYESTPEVVYVGYTPGYMGSYVYGPTVVYGTGYYYAPWYGAYYYPHPVTYGMAVAYNPYAGWGMGMAVGFSVGICMSFGGYYGGFYGPPYHHPPYHGGYHGGNYHGGGNQINIDNSNNFYRNQGGASTRPSNGNRPSSGNRPSQQPGNRPGGGGPSAGQQPANRPGGGGPSAGQQPANRPGGGPSAGQQPANNMARPSTGTPNNVMSDKQGNVYKQNDKGGYDKRSNGGWNSSPSNNQSMQRESQNRDRGSSRQNNYQSRPSGGGGGGMRGGGGRGGGGRR